MAAAISTAFTDFETDLTTVAGVAIAIGAAALLVWAGFRLAAKLTNRGVGR